MITANYGISAKTDTKVDYVVIKDIEMTMTELAQLLGRLIRERGGYLPSHDDWLEERAKEIENHVRATIPQYKVGDKVEILDLFGDPHIVKVTRVEETHDGHKRYYTDRASCFGEGTVSRLIIK